MRSRRVRKQDFETTEYNYNSWVLRNQGHLEKPLVSWQNSKISRESLTISREPYIYQENQWRPNKNNKTSRET